MDVLSFEKGSIFENGFGIVGKVVMQDRDISIQSKAIYSYICTYANNENKAFPSLSKISYDLSISTVSVTKYLKELVAKGYVTKTQERHSDGTFSKNIYTIELFTAQPTDVSADTVNNGNSNTPSTDKPIMDTPITATPIMEPPTPVKTDTADLTTNNTSISKNTSTQKNNNLKIQDNNNIFKVIEVFTQSIYAPNEDEKKLIELWTQMVEPELVIKAIAVAVKHNHKSYDYFEIVLASWYERGIRTTSDLEKKLKDKKGNGGIKNGTTITRAGENSDKGMSRKNKQVSKICGEGTRKEDGIDIDNPGKYGLI